VTGQCETLKECGSGFYNDGSNSCEPCEIGAKICDGPGQTAKLCFESFTLTNFTCHCLPDSQFEENGRCNDIIDCGAFLFNDGRNECLPCRDNCSQCDNADVCTECKNTYELNYPDDGTCSCSEGMYKYTGGNDLCYGCQGGYGCGECRNQDGYCTQCKDNWTYSRGSCLCWPPSWQNGSECDACPVGCWSCNGETCFVCRDTFQVDFPLPG